MPEFKFELRRNDDDALVNRWKTLTGALSAMRQSINVELIEMSTLYFLDVELATGTELNDMFRDYALKGVTFESSEPFPPIGRRW